MDAEAMARTLEAHPDYKLQRRLKPCLNWPGVAPGEVKTILVLDTETTASIQQEDHELTAAAGGYRHRDRSSGGPSAGVRRPGGSG